MLHNVFIYQRPFHEVVLDRACLSSNSDEGFVPVLHRDKWNKVFLFDCISCPTFHHFVYDDGFFYIFAVLDILEYLLNVIDDSMSVTHEPVTLVYTMIMDKGALSDEAANAPPKHARKAANAHPVNVAAPIIL
nr:hypothetical protein [Tanacetum cinerariifolium]